MMLPIIVSAFEHVQKCSIVMLRQLEHTMNERKVFVRIDPRLGLLGVTRFY
jgi:hypothetical protein